MIFMTNPQHGAMYATNEADAQRHESIGWTRSTHAEWLGDKLSPVEALPVDCEPKKRGRPFKVAQ